MPSFQNWENDKLGKSKKTILFNISFFTESLKTHTKKQFKILHNFKSLKYYNLAEEEGYLNGITWWWLWFRWTRACDSLRKQTTFQDATIGAPAKWRLRNECRNSILMTCHYPDLNNASHRMKQFFNQSEALPRSGYWRVISMEFLQSFLLRRHFAGKPVMESWNVGCFLSLSICEWDRIFSLWKKPCHKCSCAMDSCLAANNR